MIELKDIISFVRDNYDFATDLVTGIIDRPGSKPIIALKSHKWFNLTNNVLSC